MPVVVMEIGHGSGGGVGHGSGGNGDDNDDESGVRDTGGGAVTLFVVMETANKIMVAARLVMMPEDAVMVVAMARVAMMAMAMSVMVEATSVVFIPKKHVF